MSVDDGRRSSIAGAAGTRERILKVATRLFLREGLDAVTMRCVSAPLGLTAPAIYRHFRARDALVSAIAEEGFVIFERYLRCALVARSAGARLERVLVQYLEFALDHPSYYGLMFLTPRPTVRTYPRELDRKHSPTFTILVDRIEEGMATGLLRPGDARETALVTWAFIHGMVALKRAGRFPQGDGAFRGLYRRSVRRWLQGLRS